MTYTLEPLFCRPWTLNGISPRLIESHYENNYGAAVMRLNAPTGACMMVYSCGPAPLPAGNATGKNQCHSKFPVP